MLPGLVGTGRFRGEQERAFDHDLLAFSQASKDLQVTAELTTSGDFSPFE